jgi:hypothetical protein
MARSWQYSRYRRAIMQGVMWVVLGATVGLASLQARQHLSPAHLSAPMRFYDQDPWRIPVPDSWVPTESGGHHVDFREPVSPYRELRVMFDSVDPSVTPAVFLAAKLQLKELPIAKLIPMCGQQGIQVPIGMVMPGAAHQVGANIYSATVLPNGDAIIIRLTIPGPLTPQDMSLADAIATGIMHEPINDQLRDRPDMQKPDRPDNPDGGD